jgi:cytidylate kinase
VTTPIVIAIDGPAGSGKSTLARALAEALDLPYLNTGVMYRALTKEALLRGVGEADADGLVRLAAGITFDLDRSLRPPSLLIDGGRPGEDLSSPEVEANVSAMSGHPEIRAVMRAEQRRLGAHGGVLEGRDIGTAVFPDATLKVFLEADPKVRAERRARQLHVRVEADAIGEQLEARDLRDARVTPLEPPEDAIVIDTSNLSVAQAADLVLELLEVRIGKRRR